MLGNELQKVQSLFLRQLGGLRASVPRAVLLHEFGCKPLSRAWLRASVNYWNRVAAMPQQRLLRRALGENVCMAAAGAPSGSAAARRWCWTDSFVATLRALGMAGAADSILAAAAGGAQQLPTLSLAEAEAAYDAIWGQQWADVRDVYPRVAPSNQVHLATHAAWFMEPGREGAPYLRASERVHPQHLISLIRFRVGSHWLRVETGRWRGVPRAERVCTHCGTGAVQDEMHMVFECPAYLGQRRLHAQLFQGFGHWNGAAAGSKCMQAFMAQSQHEVAAFVHGCMEVHRSLIAVGEHTAPPPGHFEHLFSEIAPHLAGMLLTPAPYASTAGA